MKPVWLLSWLLLFPAAPSAAAEAERALAISGFGTLGLAYQGDDGAEFMRDILQPRGVADGWSGNIDTRAGLQLNYRPSAALEGVLQAVSAYDYAGRYTPELTWAFVSVAPDPAWQARAGRLGWDVYMLSDSRNVGYSYLWVRPPVDYFGPLQISHLDGADALFKLHLAGGLASAKLYAGQANQKVPSPPGDDYDLSGARVTGANLDYRLGDWLLRASHATVETRRELPAFVPLLAALRATGSPTAEALAEELALADKNLRIVSAGVVWEHGPWQAQLMANRLTTNTLAYPQKDSAYVLLGYRIDGWTPFVTYSGARSEVPAWSSGLPTPNPLDDAVAAALAGARCYQRTLSLGVRYDFMPNVDVKLQLDRVHVLDRAAFLWRNPQPDWDGRATVFSATLDFVF
jgi:hypothetical protein